ncbi:tyrosine-protein kinase RYK-like isoform X2 [Varroa destructor]|uniref:Tyrosine-protein kinase RYK n=1 Tax=Varroa destructor TaxID=109461 RepID=A0A7M7J8C6_VARDE|nr:tyrosine-protein kinase RYK-like isoform X2 [Varroa destructor]
MNARSATFLCPNGGINVDIFYVRDGAMNEYALRFSVPVKGNTVEFSWQNLKSQQQTLNYKIEIQVDRPEAMNPPKLDIPSRGQLPATPTTFVVSLPCTGRESAEVKVTISVNVSSAGDPSRITVVKIPRKKVCLKDERFIEKVITMVPTEPSQAVDDDDDENIDEMEEDSEDAEVEDNNTVLILGKGGNSISDKTVLLSSSRKNSANTTMIMDAATTPVQVSGDRNPMILAVGGAAVFVAMAFMLATTVCYVKTKKMRQATQGNIIIQAAADKYFHEWTTASSTIKTQNGGYGVITSSNLTPQQGQRLLRVGSPVASTVASYSSFRKASPPLAPSPVPPPAVSHLTLKSVGTLNSSAGQYSTIQDISASRSSLLSEQLNELAVDSACLTLVELLNEGAFGRVYYAHLSTFPAVDVQPVFVKTVKEQASAGQIEMFMQEGMMLYGMNHANVLTVFGTCLNLEGQPALIYPAMAEGNLKQFLRRSKFSQTECGHHCLTTQDLVDMGVQIAEGLMYLHRRFFLHKDVAARNCLLDERLHVKLADNSLSRDLFPDDYHCLGDGENRPVAWLAIESLNIREFTPASDLWMFGVTLWELLTLGQQPFAEIDSFEMVNYLNSGYRLAQPVNCPDELFEVMERCWVACPGERLTLPQVVRTLANFYNQLGSYI